MISLIERTRRVLQLYTFEETVSVRQYTHQHGTWVHAIGGGPHAGAAHYLCSLSIESAALLNWFGQMNMMAEHMFTKQVIFRESTVSRHS